ncbi:GNAT family N-acetyltransferase [Dactylosporangium sp. NPDC051541]|uniref:GNAT family N-acetyltransferase n=1 Tax=Dactylosporangium sp. NPDC051541 TaxID=3363977 RepID=UPI0037BD645B
MTQPGAVHIAAAGSGDVQVVREIVLAAFSHYVARIGREPAPMTADYPELVAGGHVWVARLGTGAVGALVAVPMPDHLLLETIAVLPSAQGRGVGAALLAFAEARARAAGVGEIRLYTNAAMHDNLAYYPRRGYAETHRSGASGFRRVYFHKTL